MVRARGILRLDPRPDGQGGETGDLDRDPVRVPVDGALFPAIVGGIAPRPAVRNAGPDKVTLHGVSTSSSRILAIGLHAGGQGLDMAIGGADARALTNP